MSKLAKLKCVEESEEAPCVRASAFHKVTPTPRMLTGQPLGGNLLVRKIEPKDTGLIATPETARKDTGEAEVIAVGPYVGEIAPGQHVLLRKFSGVGTEIRHEGDTYLLVSIDEILMILLS